MGKYFGEDGFRGEANVGLTPLHAYKIGRFLGWYYNVKSCEESTTMKRVGIAVGRDTRRSGEMLMAALISGITSSGADVYMLHIIPTPAVAFITKKASFHCGVMITASHNPYYDNGIKIFTSSGKKIDDNLISYIEAYLDGNIGLLNLDADIPLAYRKEIGYVIDYKKGEKEYLNFLKSFLPNTPIPLKIGFDCANGASYKLVKKVFEKIAPNITMIHTSPDGININDKCGAVHVNSLRDQVLKSDFDVGFALDGDADRCIAVDEKGNTLDGDQILYVIANYLKEKNELTNNTVVATIMSNSGLRTSLNTNGIECAFTKVGDRAVYEYMCMENCVLGGEPCGHIILGQYASTGDGILTSIILINSILLHNCKLSLLATSMQKKPHICKSIQVSNKQKILASTEVQEKANEICKIIGTSGRLILRVSGIEDIIRIMVECASDALCAKYAAEIEKIIFAVNHADQLELKD